MTSKVCVLGSYVCQMSVYLPYLPKPGETITAQNFDMGPGGKGNNVAIGIKRLGGDVLLIECLGNDLFAEIALSTYQKENINTAFVKKKEQIQSGVGLVYVQPNGENTAAYFPGANNCLSVDDILSARDSFPDVGILYVQLEIPDETIKTAICLAKELNIMVIMNPAPARKIPREILASVDILTPNQVEAMELTGTEFKEELKFDEIEIIGKKLLDLGPKEVYMTLGGKGAYYINKSGESLYQEPYKVNVIDTVGAGDAFNAALCIAKLNNKTINETLFFACLTGALTTTKFGVVNAIPTVDEVETIMNKII